MSFKQMVTDLEAKIQAAYTEGILCQDAEKLAGEFLHAQLQVSQELRNKDLEARMRKSGLKAVKAAVYMEACSKSEKKPTESQLEHVLNSNDLVNKEQNALDLAEASRDELERLYNVFQQAHVHFRQISRGSLG